MTGTADLPPLKPQDIADLTLGQLRALRDRYQTLDWQESLESLAPEDQNRAALQWMSVQNAILKLENAKLTSIRNKLVQNEKELRKARDAVKKTVKGLESTTQTLNVVGDFLTVVGRIVPLLLV